MTPLNERQEQTQALQQKINAARLEYEKACQVYRGLCTELKTIIGEAEQQDQQTKNTNSIKAMQERTRLNALENKSQTDAAQQIVDNGLV